MQSVRVWLYRNKEFLSPDENNFASYSVFYGILAGLQEKGEPFDLNKGSGNYDRNGKEIFENDIVEVSFDEGRKKVSKEICSVQFEDGCFVAFNGEGWIEDVGSFSEDDMVIISHQYREAEIEI